MTVEDETRVTLGEVMRGMTRIEEAVTKLVDSLPATYVSIMLWQLRNTEVESNFKKHGEEIADLRAELRAKRVGWPVILSSIVSGGTFLFLVIERVTA